MRCSTPGGSGYLISRMARCGIAQVGPDEWNSSPCRFHHAAEIRNRRLDVPAGSAVRFRCACASIRTRRCPSPQIARFRALHPAIPTHNPARRRSSYRTGCMRMKARRRTRDFPHRGASSVPYCIFYIAVARRHDAFRAVRVYRAMPDNRGCFFSLLRVESKLLLSMLERHPFVGVKADQLRFHCDEIRAIDGGLD